MRRRDGRLNNLLACPIIELSVRDAGHLGGHSATVAALDLLSIDVGEQLPLNRVSVQILTVLKRNMKMQPGLSHGTPLTHVCLAYDSHWCNHMIAISAISLTPCWVWTIGK